METGLSDIAAGILFYALLAMVPVSVALFFFSRRARPALVLALVAILMLVAYEWQAATALSAMDVPIRADMVILLPAMMILFLACSVRGYIATVRRQKIPVSPAILLLLVFSVPILTVIALVTLPRVFE